jgi:putative ABC transport system permease protein
MHQRTLEFGIRFSLGARKRDVIRLVLGRILRMVATGVAIGIVCAVATARLMTSLLFGVAPLDAATFITAAAAVAIVTILGCAWPVLHAARIDPAEALRRY